jgi:hypothetical protein
MTIARMDGREIGSCFGWVVEHGAFSAVARVIGDLRSSLGVAVQRLESGVRLMLRRANRRAKQQCFLNEPEATRPWRHGGPIPGSFGDLPGSAGPLTEFGAKPPHFFGNLSGFVASNASG